MYTFSGYLTLPGASGIDVFTLYSLKSVYQLKGKEATVTAPLLPPFTWG